MTPSNAIHQLKQAGLHRPKTVTLAITGACNLACCHCFVRAGESASSADVPLEAVRRLVTECAELGSDGIRITGGEPLCHPHWLDIIKFSRSLGFKSVALQTNAMLLTAEQVTALSELDFPGLSIQVSLDGVRPRTHDLVRGEGAFSGALHGIRMLVQAGLGRRISIFFTEMRHNLEEIPELLSFADKMGIGSVVTGAMVLCGRASESSLIALPEVAQYLGLLERYDRDDHFREIYAKIGTVAALEWRAGDAVRQECCTFLENPYLTPSGRLYPCLLCHCDEFSVSGVFEKGLIASVFEGAPLWSSLLAVSRSRSEALAECLDCPGKLYCAGGCTGRAWGSCENLLAADDRCQVRRAVYQKKSNSS